MKISDEGLYLIKFRECNKDAKGQIICPLAAYTATDEEADIGKYTIGYGNTFYEDGKRVKAKDKITQERAEELFTNVVQHYVDFLNKCVHVSLNQNQFDALVSFVYNIGKSNFVNSTLLKHLNQGNYNAAANDLLQWKFQKGKMLKGLLDRRIDERTQFYKELT
jgi:lysozyme